MITITINNNNLYELDGNRKVLLKLYKKYKVKNPNAFFLRRAGVMPKGWDGCTDYILESGKFKAGLFESIVKDIKGLGEKVKVIDNRFDFNVKPKLPKKVGNQKLRGYQKECVSNIINHKVAKIFHYIGVVDAATNAGKTTIMAALYHAFRRKIPTIVLLKDADLFEQFKQELPDLIPKEDLAFVRGKNIQFNKFTVVMVQTLSPKAKDYINQLAKFGMCLVDEADEGNSKTYKNIITKLYNCKIRIGLSGTIYMSKLKKDETKNMDLRCFFGDVLFKITKKEMTDMGYSTPVIVRLWPGSTLPGIKGYPTEYRENITLNKDRIKAGIDIIKLRRKTGQIPALVVFKFHEHGELIYKLFKKAIPDLNIQLIHGEVKNRKHHIQQFKEGKIDILIASYIFKRGKNSPFIRTILNLASGDSQETVSQIMGRGERKQEGKKKYNLDDFMDEGKYLKRHSLHRKKYYQQEGFKVVQKKKRITIKN